jgi:hypothetical protein
VVSPADFYAAVPDGRPFFGLFAPGTFPFVADGYTDQPSLAEMTTFALDTLDTDPDGLFLMVEGARIDHASHLNLSDKVHQETAAFDEAVAAAIAWAGTRDVTIVVTADHECGGLQVTPGTGAGEIPATTWRWGQHTNADVPVYATGRLASTFDGQRLDDTWVHAVLEASIEGDATVTPPTEDPVVDGRTDELGPVVVTQDWPTSFGVGFNQLDGLRVTADADGIRIGVDGVFEFGQNTALVLLDLDYGAGTGVGADGTTLEDTSGVLDNVLTAMPYTSGIDGMGFDLVFASIGGQELGYGDLSEVTGLRGLTGEWGTSTDYWWLLAESDYDDGNLADHGLAAVDAAATGTTSGGWEIQLPWDSVYPAGLPTGGLTIGIVAVLANDDGTYASNQALPSLPTSDEPGTAPVLLQSAVVLQVDGAGVPLGPATVAP